MKNFLINTSILLIVCLVIGILFVIVTSPDMHVNGAVNSNTIITDTVYTTVLVVDTIIYK